MLSSFLKPLFIFCVIISLYGCESVDSEDVDTADIIADIEGYRLTIHSTPTPGESIEFIVTLREDSGFRPYINLNGEDKLELLVNSSSTGFTKEESTGNIIRYHADWEDELPDPSVLVIRLSRGAGETFDSSITVKETTDIIEPAPGSAWNPDIDELIVSWENIDPGVDAALVSTLCTQEEVIENISEQTFTVLPGTLARNDTSRDTCTGYVELVQAEVQGSIATELNDQGTFILDQASRVEIEAQF